MAAVAGSFVEERLFEPTCFEKQRHDSSLSECSTASGGSDATLFDACSDQGEEGFVQTVTFFDWDDTLFPTACLQQQGLLHEDAVFQEDQMKLLEKLASGVERTLRLAMQFGRVVIVTNAQQGWVEMCCARMMPSLSGVLEEVDIVSARSTYETCSDCPSEWKRLAFEHELLASSSALQYNVISLGDSLYEQHAVMSLCEKMPNCCGKSMKFLEAPAIEQLIEQHNFVVSCFLDVAEHSGNLDVEITL